MEFPTVFRKFIETSFYKSVWKEVYNAFVCDNHTFIGFPINIVDYSSSDSKIIELTENTESSFMHCLMFYVIYSSYNDLDFIRHVQHANSEQKADGYVLRSRGGAQWLLVDILDFDAHTSSSPAFPTDTCIDIVLICDSTPNGANGFDGHYLEKELLRISIPAKNDAHHMGRYSLRFNLIVVRTCVFVHILLKVWLLIHSFIRKDRWSQTLK